MKINRLIKNVFARVKLRLTIWKDLDVIVIIGTGRTGTEFLADCFAKLYPNEVVSRHEPKPDLLQISVDSRKYAWSNSKTVLKLKLARFHLLKTCKKAGVKYYIESNNNISFLLPFLKYVFPKIKVLFFTRELESFLISEMNKRHGSKKFLLYGDDDNRERITPLLMKDNNSERWNEWGRAQKIIWYWQYCNNFVFNEIKAYEYLVVRYEDFFDRDKTYDILVRIIQFIGLPVKENIENIRTLISEKKNSSKHSDFLGVADLSPDEKKFFDEAVSQLEKDLLVHIG